MLQNHLVKILLNRRKEGGRERESTWELPGVELVEVDVGDDGDGEGGGGGFALEVVDDEFFVGGVEAKAGRKVRMLRP